MSRPYGGPRRLQAGVEAPALSQQSQEELDMAGNQGGNQGNNRGGNQGDSGRGFASMDSAQQREIASEGGKAAHRSGNAHEFTSQEAREAGRKGGQASHGGGNQGGNQGGRGGGNR
jgi:general stress protein YciG